MKKTLAAVLAAAMALSTASVAFATDHLVDWDLATASTTDTESPIEYGKDTKRIITELGDFSQEELAQLVDDGYITVTAIVTEGSSKLAAKPTISLVETKGNTTQVDKTVKTYTWVNTIVDGNGKTLVKAGSIVDKIPVYNNNGNWTPIDGNYNGETIEWLEKTHAAYAGIHAQMVTDGWFHEEEKTLTHVTASGADALQLKFKVNHTYNTSSTIIGMKLRITIKKAFDGYSKGDTYTSDEFKFKAEYHELDIYAEDMQLTLTEVDNNYVKFDASDLYDQIGADTFTLTFDDIAVFESKLSSAQKDLNLYYTVDDISEISDAYPDVDFEIITFKGAPSFTNNGTMTFNAIGGKNTTVYTFDGEVLTPLTTTYDSTYGTVTAKNIKKLGTFVVASEVLEVEEEEEEPASSAPVVEKEEDDSNPNTGAC